MTPRFAGWFGVDAVGDPCHADLVERPLRLLVYDRTCTGRWGAPGLSAIWGGGAFLYRGLGRLDAHLAATSWEQALHWLGSVSPDRSIQDIQFWGHGKWGEARIGENVLDSTSVTSAGAFRQALIAIRRRMVGDGRGLWWFRTCETFGAARGQEFARCWSDFMECRAAGHTHVIAHWQSGLHSVAPGQLPMWSDEEGLVEGTPSRPQRAAWSRPWLTNTVTCWHGSIPDGY